MSHNALRLFFITASPDLGEFALACGADRVMVDLEILGKEARQGHLNTVISRHHIGDVHNMASRVAIDRLMVRTNPLNPASADEIDSVTDIGVGTVMLPMFRGAEEVAEFSRILAGRARLCILVETAAAAADARKCAAVPGVDEVLIGLNDLSLDLQLPFMFDTLADGTVSRIATAVKSTGKPFGIGGLARLDEGLVPASDLLAVHAELGSSAAILSRTFHRNLLTPAEVSAEMNLAHEIRLLRDAYERNIVMSAEERRPAINRAFRAIREESERRLATRRGG